MRSRYWLLAGVVLVVVLGILWMLSGVSIGGIRPFYIPSEAMEPTLEKGDRFYASMKQPKSLKRGDLVLVKASAGVIYVKRVAALAGDRIRLSGGAVSLNGHLVDLKPAGTRKVSYPYLSATQARLFREQFPGEADPHVIQDLGETPEDNFQEVTVAPGHIFVLGDNRDDSADSRVPMELGGLEQVSIADVVGRPTLFYWPRAKLGKQVR